MFNLFQNNFFQVLTTLVLETKVALAFLLNIFMSCGWPILITIVCGLEKVNALVILINSCLKTN